MLDTRVKEYLDANSGKVTPEFQEKYEKLFKHKYNVNPDSAFFEFVTQYSDELYGKYGLIYDISADLMSDDNVTEFLQKKENLPSNYLSLINLESEDLLLYDKKNDHVVLIEGGNMNKLLTNSFDQEWSSFNDFLIDFFELDE